MTVKPDYDGMREKTGFRWSVNAAYYAYYCLTGIPVEDVYTKPEAMIELIRQGRPRFRELWGEEIPLPGISTPAISYGHLNTLGADLVFPKGGEANYTRVCGSLRDAIDLVKKPVDFRTAGMVPYYLDFREQLRKAFPGENVGFAFAVQGPMTTAYCLRDMEIFTDVYDDPDGAKELLDLVTESILDYKRFLADLNGQPHISPAGYKLYDDVGSMFSTSMWPEFVLPYYERIFRASTTGRRGAHIEDLRSEHMPLLEEMGLVDFDPGISHKLNPKIIRQGCRVPFGWRMGSFHFTALSLQEVDEWIYQAVTDGASSVFTTIEAMTGLGDTPGKVKRFRHTAKRVEEMLKGGATRSDIGKLVSDAGRRRFWDRWPE